MRNFISLILKTDCDIRRREAAEKSNKLCKTMEKHFVYILSCADDSLYTGYTNNLEKRLKMHNEGKASKCTRARLPVAYVHIECFDSKSEALKREAAIKKLSRKQKLMMINDEQVFQHDNES